MSRVPNACTLTYRMPILNFKSYLRNSIISIWIIYLILHVKVLTLGLLFYYFQSVWFGGPLSQLPRKQPQKQRLTGKPIKKADCPFKGKHK